MKKTPKRHLLRHTAVYTAMLLAASSQQAFGAKDYQPFNFIVNDDGSVEGGKPPGGKGVRPGEKLSYTKPDNDFPKGEVVCKKLKISSNGGCPVLVSVYHKFDFTNTDTLLAGKTGRLIFGGGSAPLWGKVSGLNADNLPRLNPNDWLTTTHKGKMGYDFSGIGCFLKTAVIGSNNQSRQCPNLPFKFYFNFKDSALDPTSAGTSPDGLPIYKLKDHPWLGVSFQLGTSTDNGAINWMAVNGNNTEIKQRITQPTDERGIGEVFELRAKLHLLGDPGNLPAQEIKLGEINMPEFAFRPPRGRTNTLYDIFEHGHVDVKLQLPGIGAGGCTRAQYTAAGPDGSRYAIVAPAPLGAGFPGSAAAVVTDPQSASSRILFYTLNKDNKEKGGADYLPNTSFTEPVFTGRKAAIRLSNGVVLSDSNINGITNSTFGIHDNNGNNQQEWKDVLLRWTDRRDGNDNQFNYFNNAIDASTRSNLYSQQYRIRTDKNRNLGDIVNSPVTAVGDYLATAANDGMVHIFKKSGNGYNLKLSYIPGTMPRKDFDNTESTLTKDLRHFANKNYTGGLYGVDGGFVLRKIKDRVFMFGAMGQGGKGAYALDLTKAESGSPTDVSLFDVKDNGLGYTVGTPQIGKIQNGKYAAFLASGYATKDIESKENQTALYVYNLEGNGTQIAKITVPGGKGGLSSPTLVDTNLDGTVDIAYAGDRGGNMYRFDLSNNDPTRWSVRTIFKGTPDKPITSAPAVSKLKDKRVVIFGTGSDLTEDDVASQEIQSVYGIFDNDKNTDAAQDGQGKGLLEQVLTKDGSTLFLSDYKRSDGSGDKGWVVKLQAGQRVTIKPTVVLRTAFVTIRNYTVNGCGAETAFLGINTADGGELTKKSARPVVPDDRVAKKVGEKKDAKGNNIPVGCMEKDNATVCPNGYVYPKLLTASYLDSQKTSGHPRTADGDAGGSGDDTDEPQEGNRCFFSKGVHTLLMNDMSDLDVVGPSCMKRISWREIFF